MKSLKISITLLLFLFICFSCNYQDPGPYGGKWFCYNIDPMLDPQPIFHPEFFDDGTVTMMYPAIDSAIICNFWYSADTLFLDNNGEIHIYTSSFPHPDTMQLTFDTTGIGMFSPVYYFYKI